MLWAWLMSWLKLESRFSSERVVCADISALRGELVCNDGAVAPSIHVALLCGPFLFRVETLAPLVVGGRRPQDDEETATLCSTGVGTSRSATATVRNFPGQLPPAAPVAALRLLLLLRWPCVAYIVMAGGCRYVALSME